MALLGIFLQYNITILNKTIYTNICIQPLTQEHENRILKLNLCNQEIFWLWKPKDLRHVAMSKIPIILEALKHSEFAGICPFWHWKKMTGDYLSKLLVLKYNLQRSACADICRIILIDLETCGNMEENLRSNTGISVAVLFLPFFLFIFSPHKRTHMCFDI